jgi:hypothetical protein
MLIEESRTNVWLQSGDATNAAWIPTGAVVAPPVTAANQTIAPDGTLTAASVTYPAMSTGTMQSSLYQGYTTAAAAYTFSMWLKGSVGGERVYLFVSPQTPFYTTACVLTTSWQRFVVTTPALTAGIHYFQLGAQLSDAQQAATPAQTIYAWGAQIEQGGFATSYTPTTAAAVTRAADAASIPTSAWFNPAAMSVISEAMSFAVPAFGGLIYVSDGTGSNRLQLSNNTGAPETTLSSAGVTSVNNPEHISVAVNAPYKFGGSLVAGTYMSSLNGGAVNTSTAGVVMPVGITTIGLGNLIGAGQFYLDGWLRRVRYWPRALSAAELQSVTT